MFSETLGGLKSRAEPFRFRFHALEVSPSSRSFGFALYHYAITSLVRQMARERFEHRHADRDAHLDLLLDQRLRPVGDLRGNLDAAVHRPRMHHERVGPGAGELLLVEAE